MNEKYKSLTIDEHELKIKQDALRLAAEQNEKINIESREIYKDFYDKILFYSAGTFSFTFALIGLVVKDKIEALAKVGAVFPNVYWLYASWIYLIIACFAALLSKRFDARYIAHFGMARYTRKYKEFVEEKTRFIKKYPEHILSSQPIPEHIRIGEADIEKLNKATEREGKREKRTYLIMRFFQTLAELSALVGSVLLLFFAYQLAEAIIWG